MSRKKTKEPTYRITLKGLIYAAVGDEQLANKVWDAIELYSYRQKFNAVILTDGGLFINVEQH